MPKKKHLYEVDLMRCFFMFGVVLNHVASTFAAALGNKATPVGRFLVSIHLILHFPRFGFMFITGLVLFLGYWGRPEKQNWPVFWKKRYIGSGIPYLFWNGLFLAFLLLTSGSFSWNKWLTGWLEAISKGSQFLLRLIAGLEAPTAGEITMNGQKLSGLNQQAQVMFQDDRLLPWKTVLGNLLMTRPNWPRTRSSTTPCRSS